ncbi:hypothetical protein I3F58_12855 [Streptomyces sp. MUM 203J]|uniref:hypothetical protein n=1 Tax=Streptomyces sp. MUM 203J TaxID=2791990 RepID=UPI001F038B13|nr:hypothetical protein [Streptomyces sp. MUM 203J]MCH0540443.1 hypothetical protein [Streptomyces sp. MUM 203J]
MYGGRGARMRAGVVAVAVTAALLAVGCTSGPGGPDPEGGGPRTDVSPRHTGTGPDVWDGRAVPEPE